ncbi:hypothetical protein HZP34_02935 [Elizabethkingia anophelis]|nr:hypothetical protein [Elizabethkingia anophelis]
MNVSLTGKRKQYMITKLQNDIFSTEQLLIDECETFILPQLEYINSKKHEEL